jgi:hypothetical protein
LSQVLGHFISFLMSILRIRACRKYGRVLASLSRSPQCARYRFARREGFSGQLYHAVKQLSPQLGNSGADEAFGVRIHGSRRSCLTSNNVFFRMFRVRGRLEACDDMVCRNRHSLDRKAVDGQNLAQLDCFPPELRLDLAADPIVLYTVHEFNVLIQRFFRAISILRRQSSVIYMPRATARW